MSFLPGLLAAGRALLAGPIGQAVVQGGKAIAGEVVSNLAQKALSSFGVGGDNNAGGPPGYKAHIGTQAGYSNDGAFRGVGTQPNGYMEPVTTTYDHRHAANYTPVYSSQHHPLQERHDMQIPIGNGFRREEEGPRHTPAGLAATTQVTIPPAIAPIGTAASSTGGYHRERRHHRRHHRTSHERRPHRTRTRKPKAPSKPTVRRVHHKRRAPRRVRGESGYAYHEQDLGSRGFPIL